MLEMIKIEKQMQDQSNVIKLALRLLLPIYLVIFTGCLFALVTDFNISVDLLRTKGASIN